MKKSLILIGGGGHCRSCIDVIESEGIFSIEAIVDTEENLGKEVLGYAIKYTDKDLPDLKKKYDYALITIGQIKSAKNRVNYYKQLKDLGFELPIIISPRAHLSKHSSVEEGTILLHDVVVNANATIGKNCILNTKSLVEHDVEIGDHCHISTGAIVNGTAKVGPLTFIGSNAVTRESISITEGSIIPAGERVMKDLKRD